MLERVLGQERIEGKSYSPNWTAFVLLRETSRRTGKRSSTRLRLFRMVLLLGYVSVPVDFFLPSLGLNAVLILFGVPLSVL